MHCILNYIQSSTRLCEVHKVEGVLKQAIKIPWHRFPSTSHNPKSELNGSYCGNIIIIISQFEWTFNFSEMGRHITHLFILLLFIQGNTVREDLQLKVVTQDKKIKQKQASCVLLFCVFVLS